MDVALQRMPPARNVTAHCCPLCQCPDVDPGCSSEGSVGTATTALISAGSQHSGSGLHHRGGTGSGSQNGHVVNVNQDGDDDDGLCVADVVANNLKELNSGRYEKLRFAFEDWEKTFETFQKRREYKEAQRDAIRNEIYQVIGFYIVFQGVLITAVAQASVLRCRNWWTTFILSLLTSLVTIGAVLQKLSEFWALETTIASVISSAKVLKTRINDVKLNIGPQNFDFKKNAKDGRNNELVRPGITVQLYRFAVVSVLLCFSTLFLVSSWRILCRPGKGPD